MNKLHVFAALCFLWLTAAAFADTPATLRSSIVDDQQALEFIADIDSYFEQDKELTMALAEQALSNLRAEDIKEKVQLLNRLGRLLFLTNPEKTVDYNLRSIELVQETEFKAELAKAYNDLGIGYFYLSDYPKAREAYQSSLEINKDIGNMYRVAGSLNNLALVSSELGDHVFAFDLHKQAYEIYLDVGDEVDLADVQSNIALVLMRLERYQEAQNYMFQVLEIYQKLGDPTNIAYASDFLGVIYQRQGLWESSRKLHHHALEIAIEKKLNYYITNSHNNLSTTELKLGQLEKAIEHAKISAKLAAQHGYHKVSVGALHSLATALLATGDTEEALKYAQQSFEAALNIEEASKIAESYEQLSDIYRVKGDYKQAYEFQKLFKETNDGIVKNRYDEQVSARNYAFEQLKYQNELALAESERQRIDDEGREELKRTARYYQIIIAFFVVSCVGLVFVLYRQKLAAQTMRNKLIDQHHSYQREIKSLILNLMQFTPISQSKKGSEEVKSSSANPLIVACQDAFDFQSIQRGELFLTMRDISVNNFLDYISDTISVAFGLSNRAIEVDFRLIDGMIRADKQRCSKVINALVGFFASFDTDEKIHISAKVYNQRLIISFEDLSVYLSQDMYQQFLEVTQPLPEAMAQFSGSRLAIPLALELMRKQQARLLVNPDENRGTIASLSFPLL